MMACFILPTSIPSTTDTDNYGDDNSHNNEDRYYHNPENKNYNKCLYSGKHCHFNVKMATPMQDAYLIKNNILIHVQRIGRTYGWIDPRIKACCKSAISYIVNYIIFVKTNCKGAITLWIIHNIVLWFLYTALKIPQWALSVYLPMKFHLDNP